MSKKHFIALARELLACRPDNARSTKAGKAWIAACHAVADVSQHANPAFNRERFLTACGV